MTIKQLKAMTRDQLLKSEGELKEVTYQSDRTQINLKDGIFTVGSLRRLAGLDTLTWGA